MCPIVTVIGLQLTCCDGVIVHLIWGSIPAEWHEQVRKLLIKPSELDSVWSSPIYPTKQSEHELGHIGLDYDLL